MYNTTCTMYIFTRYIYENKLQFNDRNTIKTSKVNTINVSHESMKLTWTSAEQIPPLP